MPATDLPRCVRIEFEDARSANELLADGWRQVEVLEQWAGEIAGTAFGTLPIPAVAGAEPEDLFACLSIAVHAFGHDRLHADPAVPDAVAVRAKQQWIRDAFAGGLENILAARDGGQTVGFCILKPDSLAVRIDLIAVRHDRMKRGLGRQMLHAAASWSPNKRVLLAGTQATNFPARRLYCSAGMRCVAKQRTFHK